MAISLPQHWYLSFLFSFRQPVLCIWKTKKQKPKTTTKPTDKNKRCFCWEIIKFKGHLNFSDEWKVLFPCCVFRTIYTVRTTSKLLMKLVRTPKHLCAPLYRSTGARRGTRLRGGGRREGAVHPPRASQQRVDGTDELALGGGIVTACTLSLFYKEYLWL